MATAAEGRYMSLVATVPCLVCTRFQRTGERVELHHVAEGSSLRSNWAVVPLCAEHHRGGSGFHGMGSKGFCGLYRPPGEVEYGLIVWLLSDLERLKLLRVAA